MAGDDFDEVGGGGEVGDIEPGCAACVQEGLTEWGDDLDFFDWLSKVDQIEQGMTGEDVYWTTLLGIIEMLKSGTTCFVDMNIKSAKALTGPESGAAGAALESGME